MSYPHAPALGRTDTSADAAASIAPASNRLRHLTLCAIKDAGPAGLTADEAARAVRVDHLSIRPRATELRQLGLIRDSGERRPNANGKSAIVWVVT